MRGLRYSSVQLDLSRDKSEYKGSAVSEQAFETLTAQHLLERATTFGLRAQALQSQPLQKRQPALTRTQCAQALQLHPLQENSRQKPEVGLFVHDDHRRGAGKSY